MKTCRGRVVRDSSGSKVPTSKLRVGTRVKPPSHVVDDGRSVPFSDFWGDSPRPRYFTVRKIDHEGGEVELVSDNRSGTIDNNLEDLPTMWELA